MKAKELIGWLVAVVLGLLLFYCSCSEDEQNTIDVPTYSGDTVIEKPEPIVLKDTVYLDSVTVKVVERANPINKELLSKYEAATALSDSLKQLQLYKEAITERKYKEQYEDSVIIITIYSNVVGTLERQKIEYKTKPQTIEFNRYEKKHYLYGGVFSYASFDEFAVGLELDLMNKEQNKIYRVGYDTEKRVHFGVTFKLF